MKPLISIMIHISIVIFLFYSYWPEIYQNLSLKVAHRVVVWANLIGFFHWSLALLHTEFTSQILPLHIKSKLIKRFNFCLGSFGYWRVNASNIGKLINHFPAFETLCSFFFSFESFENYLHCLSLMPVVIC